MRWVLALVLAALSACSSAAPSPEPSRSPDVEAATVQEFVGEDAPLEPVRTRYSAFEPPFTFLVPEGWSGGHEHEDYFDVWDGEDLVIGFARPVAIPTSEGPVAWDSVTPNRALRLIGELGAEPGPIAETQVDGRPALERSFSVERRTGLLRFGAGVFHVEPPWRQRAIALEVDGTLLLILVQRMAPGDEADEASVLSSIDFDA
ncbi:MAG TPA: hypothetical protein VFP13_07795 [Actinomycetota bacterium]|nr:hypothetical protein [Actinomycetota bacterium]